MSDERDPLSDGACAVLARVPSIDHLEVLLLIVRGPAREWTAGDVADELFGDTRLTAQLLRDLVRAELLVAIAAGRRRDRDTFHFAPNDDRERRAVDELRCTYDHNSFAVIRAFRARNARSIQSLADAFRFRPPREGGRG